MKKAVVSFADGTGHYRTKMKRLEQSVKKFSDADFLGFTDIKQIGCKPHSVVPYAFKPYAIQAAVNQGYDLILWCDSPIHAVKDLGPVFEYIEENKYMFFENIGHNLGKWCNDKALDSFGVTREQAMDIKQIMACSMGFNFSDGVVRKWFDEYIGLSDDLYPGDWTGPQAHRHDQSVASLLIHEYGLNILNGQQTFFMYEAHRFAVPINEPTICLISE